MNRTRIILVVLLLVLVVVGALVVLPTLNQTPAPVDPAAQTGEDPVPAVEETPLPTATPIAFVNLVVAVQELPRGFRIPANAVAVVQWPEVSAPFNGVTDLEQVVGKIARTDIFREQPILSNMLVDDFENLANTLGRVGSDAAAILPNGLQAVAVPMDRLTSVAYAVQDGDRVDVIISMLFVDVDEEFQSLLPNNLTVVTRNPETNELTFGIRIPGRVDSGPLGPVVVEPSERSRPRLVSQRTIQDALVVHVGNFPSDGRFIGIPPTPTPPLVEEEETEGGTPPPPTPTPTRPDIITLGVTPQEAVLLTYLIEARTPITFALRSSTDTSRAPTTPVTLDYLMNTYNIDVPEKREYALEPAIRSIRQLVAIEQIQLAPGAQ